MHASAYLPGWSCRKYSEEGKAKSASDASADDVDAWLHAYHAAQMERKSAARGPAPAFNVAPIAPALSVDPDGRGCNRSRHSRMALRARRLAALGGVAAAATAAGVYATDTRDRRRAWALCEAAGRAATLVGVVGYVAWNRARHAQGSAGVERPLWRVSVRPLADSLPRTTSSWAGRRGGGPSARRPKRASGSHQQICSQAA